MDILMPIGVVGWIAVEVVVLKCAWAIWVRT